MGYRRRQGDLMARRKRVQAVFGKTAERVRISQVDNRVESRIMDYVSAMKDVAEVTQLRSKNGSTLYGIYKGSDLIATASFDSRGECTLSLEDQKLAGFGANSFEPLGPNSARNWVRDLVGGAG